MNHRELLMANICNLCSQDEYNDKFTRSADSLYSFNVSLCTVNSGTILEVLTAEIVVY